MSPGAKTHYDNAGAAILEHGRASRGPNGDRPAPVGVPAALVLANIMRETAAMVCDELHGIQAAIRDSEVGR